MFSLVFIAVGLGLLIADARIDAGLPLIGVGSLLIVFVVWAVVSFATVMATLRKHQLRRLDDLLSDGVNPPTV
jgi:hypothetical protein